MSKRIAVLVELDTDDPLLCADPIDVSTVEATVRLRAAVVDALPGMVGVVAVLPIETARLMMRAHDAAMEASGLTLDILRPPAGYRPPHGR